jgi:hypothetical protein
MLKGTRKRREQVLSPSINTVTLADAEDIKTRMKNRTKEYRVSQM